MSLEPHPVFSQIADSLRHIKKWMIAIEGRISQLSQQFEKQADKDGDRREKDFDRLDVAIREIAVNVMLLASQLGEARRDLGERTKDILDRTPVHGFPLMTAKELSDEEKTIAATVSAAKVAIPFIRKYLWWMLAPIGIGLWEWGKTVLHGVR